MPGSLSPPVSSDGPSAVATSIDEQRSKVDKMPPIDSGICTPDNSGSSTPSSLNELTSNSLSSPLSFVEFNVDRNSDSIFIYDSAKFNGFGDSLNNDKVHFMQDRNGAGNAIIGYSRSSQLDHISILITSKSLLNFVPTLKNYDEKSKIVIQVQTFNRDDEDLSIKSSFTNILQASQQLDNWTFLLSSTPQDVIFNSKLAYELPGNVIHAFDGVYAAREKGLYTQPRKAFVPVTYHGSSNVSKALVVPASDISNILLSKLDSSFGLIIVHQLRPLNLKTLSEGIPSTIENLLVYNDELAQGVLLNDVVSAVFNSQRKIKVNAFKNVKKFFSSSTANANSKSCLFVDQPNQISADLVGSLFSQNKTLKTKVQTIFDNFIGQTGLALSQVKIGLEDDLTALTLPLNNNSADFLSVHLNSLKHTNVFKYVKENGIVLIDGPLQSPDEVPAKLSYSDKLSIIKKGIRVWIIDSVAISEQHQSVASLVAFLLLFTSSVPRLPHSIHKLLHEFLPSFTKDQLGNIINNTEGSLYESIPNDSWIKIEEGKEIKPDNRLVGINFNGFTPNAVGTENGFESPKIKSVKGSWVEPAWQFLFKEAFAINEIKDNEKPLATLKPSIPENTYLITVSENRRLTPSDYDRNVFHMSFDTSGTGLKYEIGEALGVYGHNDENEVRDFLNWYGLPEHGIISVEFDNGKIESRTVFQIFQQDIDLFGKPPKSFYAALEEHAKSRDEQRTLRFISSAEGSSHFKKISEIDTLTYADVLKAFPSAKPTVQELIHMVGEIHPRHYSIASSQAVVGDQVDLLIVTVEWKTPSGTLYLKNRL